MTLSPQRPSLTRSPTAACGSGLVNKTFRFKYKENQHQNLRRATADSKTRADRVQAMAAPWRRHGEGRARPSPYRHLRSGRSRSQPASPSRDAEPAGTVPADTEAGGQSSAAGAQSPFAWLRREEPQRGPMRRRRGAGMRGKALTDTASYLSAEAPSLKTKLSRRR